MRVMHIPPDASGTFLVRKNRFVGEVRIGDRIEDVHIHDPGRLQELLYSGNDVLLKKASGKGRKTSWDLIAARYGDMWVFTNSGYHRRISESLLKSMYPSHEIRSEVKLGNSRIDFILESSKDTIAVEVKGCTLARDGFALFPDAPTSRGKRHVEELIRFVKDGGKALIVFLVFRYDARCFLPNGKTDPEFEEVFWEAMRVGVKAKPLLLKYDGEWIIYLREIPVCDFE